MATSAELGGAKLSSLQEKLQQSLEELRSVLQKFHEQLDMARPTLFLRLMVAGYIFCAG